MLGSDCERLKLENNFLEMLRTLIAIDEVDACTIEWVLLRIVGRHDRGSVLPATANSNVTLGSTHMLNTSLSTDHIACTNEYRILTKHHTIMDSLSYGD